MNKENESMGKSQKEEPIGENPFASDNRVFRLKKISCPSCGGAVEINKGEELATCPFCRNQFSIAKENPDFTIDREVLVKYNGNNSEVEVPSGVRAIAISAFQNQSTLKKIVLPEGVSELQGNNFQGCSNLETVILPDSLENIPQMIFTGCVSLKSIDLPKNLKNIGAGAFSDCKNLTSIEIPPMVESVDINAVFFGCESLETIFSYENTRFKRGYIQGCDSLSSINVLDSKTGEMVSKKRVVLEEFTSYKIVEDVAND
ncbi:MAG: leucine-rich repeat domain-containing protein [Methanobrevibacter sp.]|nr:leucine-rich repeat domain-containing protein [Methanobrevibacter sp.]